MEAIDISPEMLAEAEANDRIHYQIAPAERLPFEHSTFDLITVGLAFHWFDQAAFLKEARRVLKPDGRLVVYTSGFSGEMVEDGAFRRWAWEVYPKRFPTPPRRSGGVSHELVEPFGFRLQGTERFTHNELMSVKQLTDYLLTQINVIALVESSNMPIDEAAAWIATGIAPFFSGQRRTMSSADRSGIWYSLCFH